MPTLNGPNAPKRPSDSIRRTPRVGTLAALYGVPLFFWRKLDTILTRTLNGRRIDQDICTRQARYKDPIWDAITEGSLCDVQTCVRQDPKCLHARGDVGETPLHWCFLRYAAKQRRLADWILCHDPSLARDVYEQDLYKGESVLHMAIAHYDIEMVKGLVALCPELVHCEAVGAYFRPPNPCYFGEVPLSFAACLDQPEMVTVLLAAGADPTFTDSLGNSIFHLLVWHSLPDMYDRFEALWDSEGHGDPSHLLNKELLTPVTLAAKLGKKEMFVHLVEKTKERQWEYGNMTLDFYPLDELDYVPPTGPRRPTAIELIIQLQHTEFLELPMVRTILDLKWKAVSPIYYRQFATSLFHALALTTSVILRSESDPLLLCLCWFCADVTFFLAIHRLRRLWRKTKTVGWVKVYSSGVASVISNLTTLVLGFFVVAYAACVVLCVDAAGDEFLAGAAVAAWLYLFFFHMAFQATGPLIVMIFAMVGQDLLRFLLIFAVFSLAYSLAFTILCDQMNPSGFFYRLSNSLLTIVGHYAPLTEGCDGHLPLTVTVLLVANVVLVSVLLVNLLVAMMGSTYARISEASNSQWLREWAAIVTDLHHEHAVGQYWEDYHGRRFFRVMATVEITAFEDTLWFKTRPKAQVARPKASHAWRKVGLAVLAVTPRPPTRRKSVTPHTLRRPPTEDLNSSFGF